MDGTLTPVRSIWQYIHERLGTWEDQGRRSLEDFLNGRITYHQFAKRDALAWRGVTREQLDQIVAEIPLRPGVTEMICSLRERGYHLAILSSGLNLLVARAAKLLGFDYFLCNELGFSTEGVANGKVTVRVGWNGKPGKIPVVCRRFGVEPANVAMVGDGAGDATVFPLVGLGVAFNAPPNVEAYADAVVRGDDARVLLPVLLPGANGQ